MAKCTYVVATKRLEEMTQEKLLILMMIMKMSTENMTMMQKTMTQHSWGTTTIRERALGFSPLPP